MASVLRSASPAGSRLRDPPWRMASTLGNQRIEEIPSPAAATITRCTETYTPGRHDEPPSATAEVANSISASGKHDHLHGRPVPTTLLIPATAGPCSSPSPRTGERHLPDPRSYQPVAHIPPDPVTTDSAPGAAPHRTKHCAALARSNGVERAASTPPRYPRPAPGRSCAAPQRRKS